MKSRGGKPEDITRIDRGPGKLRRVTTSLGKVYLVLCRPENSKYLEAGRALSPADLDELEGKVAAEAGIHLSIALLSRRDRTEHQIRKALAGEGIDNQETIDYIVENLRRRRYLDDRRFAGEFVDCRLRTRPAGPALVRKKLIEAGVDEEIADEKIRAAFSGDAEQRMAEALARARLEGMRHVDAGRAARRINGYLSRRGFSAPIVNGICAGILRDHGSGEEDEQQNTNG